MRIARSRIVLDIFARFGGATIGETILRCSSCRGGSIAIKLSFLNDNGTSLSVMPPSAASEEKTCCEVSTVMMSRYLVTDQYGPYKGLSTKCTGSSPRSRAKKPGHVSSEYRYGLLTSISSSGTDQGSRCASALKSIELRGATDAFIDFSSRCSRRRRERRARMRVAQKI